MQIDLTGKVAVVTGAGSGIGRELSLTLAREGCRVVPVDLDSQLADDVGLDIAAIGAETFPSTCDVRDELQVVSVIERIHERFGRIDILVNNAGVAVGGMVEDLPADRWDLNFEVNTRGTFLMCRSVIPIMKEQRAGRIINAASFAAIVPAIGGAAYAASKSAVHNFTRVLAGELGPWNVTVNCYAPGMVPTRMNNFDKLSLDKEKVLLDTLTLRRWQSAADVANLVCFLASDLASYITGTMIDVSGGKLATQRPYVAYESSE